MKKSLVKRVLVLAAMFALVCMVGIAYAADTSGSNAVSDKGADVNQPENAASKKIECSKTPASNLFAAGSSSTMFAANKGRDGAACSGNSECIHVCEGGSCCTNYGDPCNSSSHCCGHQSCNNGKCPN